MYALGARIWTRAQRDQNVLREATREKNRGLLSDKFRYSAEVAKDDQQSGKGSSAQPRKRGATQSGSNRKITIPIDLDMDALVEDVFAAATDDDSPSEGDAKVQNPVPPKPPSPENSVSATKSPTPKDGTKAGSKASKPAFSGLPTRSKRPVGSGPLPVGGLPVRGRSRPEPAAPVQKFGAPRRGESAPKKAAKSPDPIPAPTVSTKPDKLQAQENPAPVVPATSGDSGSRPLFGRVRPGSVPHPRTRPASAPMRIKTEIAPVQPETLIDRGSGSGSGPLPATPPATGPSISSSGSGSGPLPVRRAASAPTPSKAPIPASSGSGSGPLPVRRAASAPAPSKAPLPSPKPTEASGARPLPSAISTASAATSPATSPVTPAASARPIVEKNVPASKIPGPAKSVPASKRIQPKSEAKDPFARQALSMIHTWQDELDAQPDLFRAARLYYEIARLLEFPLGDLEQAQAAYQKALRLAPDHLPTIRGTRRVLLARKQFKASLELFDTEIKLTSDPNRKANLKLQKGRLLEDRLSDPMGARASYSGARSLHAGDAGVLKALEQSYQSASDWSDLADTYGQVASAVERDPKHRAAVIVRRAHLREVQQGDTRGAVELYEMALHLDPYASGAFAALKRLHHQEKRWRDLIHVLEREAQQTQSAELRAMAFYRISRIQSERLGARDKAILALERSVAEAPHYRLVFEELIRLYEAAERYDDLVRTHERLLGLIDQSRERIGVLYRLGDLYESRIRDDESAITRYEESLAIEPTYKPALRALSKLYTRRKDWDALIKMNMNEADAATDNIRVAAAHARIAELYERHHQDNDAAIKHHSRALTIHPGLAVSFKALVRLFTEVDRHHELIELYERGIDQTRDNERKIAYLFRIGDIYTDALNEPIQAAHAYRRILKIHPQHLGAMHALQRATESAGRYKELVEALELEAHHANDSTRIVPLLHRAGEVLDTDLDDREGALARYRKVLTLDPKYEPALASCGRLYYRMGRWEELLAIYEQELAIAPEGPAAVALLQAMGELCETKLGRESQAISLYRRAVAIDPRHGPSLHALARRLRLRGDWKELVEVLDLELRGLSENKARSLTAYRIGRVYEEHIGNTAKALAAYQQALAPMPDYRPAVDGIARVRAQRKEFSEIVDDLAREAQSTSEPAFAISALLRAGEIWNEHLQQPDRAIACYESVLERDPKNLAALMAVEPLYRAKSSWKSLYEVYQRQVEALSDEGAQVACLREMTRLIELYSVADQTQLEAAHRHILARASVDSIALQELESMALGSDNDELLMAVEAQALKGDEDPALMASYHERMGQIYERRDQLAQALASYEAAIGADTSSLGSMHALVRTATALDDPRAMAAGMSRLAGAERSGEKAADLLLQTAKLRLERLDDPEGATRDLELALERWPDHSAVATQLRVHLLTLRKPERLVEKLSTAAESAQSTERAAGLWMMVAELYADDLDNLAGGIALLRRTMRDFPEDIELLMLLANFYSRNSQWSDAAEMFERVIKLSSDVEILCDANSTLAVVASDRLGDLERARACLEAVLLLRPDDRSTLRMLTDIHSRRGDPAAAMESARQLLRASTTLDERISSIIHLAEIEFNVGHRAEALEVLLSAIAIEGPSGMAAREYKSRLTEDDSWEAYEGTLIKYLQQHGSRGSGHTSAVDTYLELSRIQANQLGRQKRAIATLEMGIEDVSDDRPLRLEYGVLLRKVGRHTDAVRAYRQLIERSPEDSDGWSGLVQAYLALKKNIEAALALAPMSILGTASEANMRTLAKVLPEPASAQPGTMPVELLRILVDRKSEVAPAETLLAVVGSALAKLYPADLQNYGLTTRDRITARTSSPIRSLCDRVAEIFGVVEFDLYVYRGSGSLVSIDFGSVPMMLVPAPVLRLPVPQQVFTVSRAMFSIARNLEALYKFKPQDLKLILAAAARSGAPSFGSNLADGAALDELQRRIMRAMPRKERRTLEDAAKHYAANPTDDFVAWLSETRFSATRAAAVIAGDLPSCVSLMRAEDQSLAYLEGQDLVINSELVADLLRYWSSEQALELRRKAGLLPR